MTSTTIVLSIFLAQAGGLSTKDFFDTPSIEQPDTQRTAANISRERFASKTLSDPIQQQIILSGILCEAKQRKADVEVAIEKGLTKPLVRASLNADKDIESAKVKLRIMEVTPLPCSNRDVEKLTECLAPAAPLWCELNLDVASRVAAAELISDVDNQTVSSPLPFLPSSP
jgi:hypothetical protein